MRRRQRPRAQRPAEHASHIMTVRFTLQEAEAIRQRARADGSLPGRPMRLLRFDLAGKGLDGDLAVAHDEGVRA
jgi:hypothetical protein